LQRQIQLHVDQGKQEPHKHQRISGGREIHQTRKDFSVARRLREEKGKGKGKTLEAILRS